MDQTAVAKMIGPSKTPGDSDTRHSTPKTNNQRYLHCITDGTTIKQNNPSSRIQYPNKPHLNVTLDKTHKIKALVDSGSAISFADLSTLNHITNKATGGPPISMTSCHNSWVNSQGCYKATIDVDEDLNYPTGAKQIVVHVINNLSSELILGNDFLKENGAVINLADNSVIFPPKRTTAIARSNSQILQGTTMVFGEGTTPYEDLMDNHQNTHTLHPRETEPLGQRDQIKFHAESKANTSTIFIPGTTATITSSLTHAPHVTDDLHSTKDNNMVQVTIRNAKVYQIGLIMGKPITETTVHLLASKPEDTLRTHPGENTELTYAHYPSRYTPKQHWENKNLQHYTPLLNPGINNPGMRKHPTLGSSTMVTKNLPIQLDTKDVEQDRIPAYQQIIPRSYNVYLHNKSDMGLIPHHHHRIACTTDQPTDIHHYETSVAAEHPSNELVTNPTATHTLIEQPDVRNTPIFMVAIKDGPGVGTGRFVQDFRKRNTAYHDEKNITQNSRITPTVTNRFKPGVCSENSSMSTACGPPWEKLPPGMASSESPLKNTQYNRTRALQDPRGIGRFLSKPHQFQITKERTNHENNLVTTTTIYERMQKTLNTIFTNYPLHKVKLRPDRSMLKQKEPMWLGYSTEELHRITLQRGLRKLINTLNKEVKDVFPLPEEIQMGEGTRPMAKAGRHNVTETVLTNSDREEHTFPFRAYTIGWTPIKPLMTEIRVGHSPGAGRFTITGVVSDRTIQETHTFPFPARIGESALHQPLTERTELREEMENLSGTGPLTITRDVSTGSVQEVCTFPFLANVTETISTNLDREERTFPRRPYTIGWAPLRPLMTEIRAGPSPGAGQLTVIGIVSDKTIQEACTFPFMAQIEASTFIGTRLSTLTGVIPIPIYGPTGVKRVVKNCGTPIETTENQEVNKQVQYHKTTPTHNNTRWYMDITGPLITKWGQRHIFAITNTFTRYTELVEIPNGETTTVTQALLNQWIVRHGFYEQIISDHGRNKNGIHDPPQR